MMVVGMVMEVVVVGDEVFVDGGVIEEAWLLYL